MPGRRFVILGSGDIGMIMARRLTLEGAEVAAMLEILPYVSGLRRNLVQCVRDFQIPLHLCTTVTEVRGRDRVESVIVSGVDEQWRPIAGTAREIPCDTLLLSVGLIPENELSRMAGVAIDPITGGPYVDEGFATNVPGIYAAGNVVHVYDLVDDVSENARIAGRSAGRYATQGASPGEAPVRLLAGDNVRHLVPHTLHPSRLEEGAVVVNLRARQPIEAPVRVQVRLGDETLLSRRRRYVRPSEMIALTLPPALASRLAGADAITIDLVP